MELIPDVPKRNPKGQEFVWKNGFIYQIYSEVKKKTPTKDEFMPNYSIFKIVKYEKEKYLDHFQSKYDELLGNYESWEEITFTYFPLGIEEKLKLN